MYNVYIYKQNSGWKLLCTVNIFHNKCVNTGAVFSSVLGALVAVCFASILLCILKKALSIEVSHWVHGVLGDLQWRFSAHTLSLIWISVTICHASIAPCQWKLKPRCGFCWPRLSVCVHSPIGGIWESVLQRVLFALLVLFAACPPEPQRRILLRRDTETGVACRQPLFCKTHGGFNTHSLKCKSSLSSIKATRGWGFKALLQ